MPTSPGFAKYREPSSALHLVAGLVLAGGAVGALWGSSRGCAATIVVLVDVYLVCLLLLTALISDGFTGCLNVMPRRLPALLLAGLLFTTIIVSFAELYREHGVYTTGEHPELLATASDSLYFSTVTITTLGYGDYVPVTRCARLLTMWELGTGVLFIIAALPVLLSRMATWETRDP